MAKMLKLRVRRWIWQPKKLRSSFASARVGSRAAGGDSGNTEQLKVGEFVEYRNTKAFDPACFKLHVQGQNRCAPDLKCLKV